MTRSQFRSNEDLRYEVDDRIPGPLALAFGAQFGALALNGVVLMPTIVFRAAGAEELVLWAVFASLLACGVSAIMQGAQVGRIGAGYALTHVSWEPRPHPRNSSSSSTVFSRAGASAPSSKRSARSRLRR